LNILVSAFCFLRTLLVILLMILSVFKILSLVFQNCDYPVAWCFKFILVLLFFFSLSYKKSVELL
jgi:hypothetical protein